MTRAAGLALGLLALAARRRRSANRNRFALSDSAYFEARGVNVLVFANWYSGLFSDSKLSGVELIHHGVRTATNGDVRLSPTPEQWDPIPTLAGRHGGPRRAARRGLADLPDYGFGYRGGRARRRPVGRDRRAAARRAAARPALVGRAGFNLEFLPSAYFGKSWLMDGRSGLFPRGGRRRDGHGRRPARGGAARHRLHAGARARGSGAPGRDRSRGAGRSRCTTGARRRRTAGSWCAASSPPAARARCSSGAITPHQVPGWIRPPVIAHSQVGYHPLQAKVAVLESDPERHVGRHGHAAPDRGRRDAAPCGSRSRPRPGGGSCATTTRASTSPRCGSSGVYEIAYRGVRSEPFRIADDVYGPEVWTRSLDTYLPEQMDHVLVRDRYRVWHGASHLDDARQAPPNHVHFDLYAQGPTTDTPYRPGEHIPGLERRGLDRRRRLRHPDREPVRGRRDAGPGRRGLRPRLGRDDGARERALRRDPAARRRPGRRAAGRAWRPATARAVPRRGARHPRDHRADARAVHLPGRRGLEDGRAGLRLVAHGPAARRRALRRAGRPMGVHEPLDRARLRLDRGARGGEPGPARARRLAGGRVPAHRRARLAGRSRGAAGDLPRREHDGRPPRGRGDAGRGRAAPRHARGTRVRRAAGGARAAPRLRLRLSRRARRAGAAVHGRGIPGADGERHPRLCARASTACWRGTRSACP